MTDRFVDADEPGTHRELAPLFPAPPKGEEYKLLDTPGKCRTCEETIPMGVKRCTFEGSDEEECGKCWAGRRLGRKIGRGRRAPTRWSERKGNT